MFLDWKQAPPPQPWEPAPRKAPKRDEIILLRLIGLALLAVLLAPFGGASLFHAVAYVLGR